VNMEKQRLELIEFVRSQYGFNTGDIQTQIPSLAFFVEKHKTENTNIKYEPSFCAILQGKKAVGFGNSLYTYGQNEYLIASTHLPAKVQVIEASNDKPYLSYRIQFKLEDIYDVLKNTNPTNLNLKKKALQSMLIQKAINGKRLLKKKQLRRYKIRDFLRNSYVLIILL